MSAIESPATQSQPIRNYRWVVFDAVGTLIHPDPPVPVAYQSIAARYGSKLSVEEVGRRFRKAFRQTETEAFPNGPSADKLWVSSDAIEKARWRWIVEQVVPDVDDPEAAFLELWNHFADPASWSCFPDVEESLCRLSQAGIQLAIASNFDSRLHSVCAGHDQLSPVQHRFVSSETGFRKPAPHFYARLIESCQCDPAEILMIGDDLEHDVTGPIAAGMQAFLIDRRTTTPAPHTLRSLSELPIRES